MKVSAPDMDSFDIWRSEARKVAGGRDVERLGWLAFNRDKLPLGHLAPDELGTELLDVLIPKGGKDRHAPQQGGN